MKTAFYILSIIALISCTPQKSGDIVTVEVYCDSCNTLIQNSWYNGDNSGTETVYNGVVNGFIQFQVERYMSDIPCIRTDVTDNYSTDTPYVLVIENNDTTFLLHGGASYCY